jgi:hypothetical protein
VRRRAVAQALCAPPKPRAARAPCCRVSPPPRPSPRSGTASQPFIQPPATNTPPQPECADALGLPRRPQLRRAAGCRRPPVRSAQQRATAPRSAVACDITATRALVNRRGLNAALPDVDIGLRQLHVGGADCAQVHAARALQRLSPADHLTACSPVARSSPALSSRPRPRARQPAPTPATPAGPGACELLRRVADSGLDADALFPQLAAHPFPFPVLFFPAQACRCEAPRASSAFSTCTSCCRARRYLHMVTPRSYILYLCGNRNRAFS